MRLKQIVLHPLVIIAVTVLIFLRVQTCMGAHTAVEQAAREQRLASAESVAVIERGNSTRALAFASHADSVARKAQAAAVNAGLRAQQLDAKYQNVRAQFDSVSAIAADTCGPVIERARIALAGADSVAAALAGVVAIEHARGNSLSVALDTTSAALRRLLAADSAVGRAATAIVNAAHPSFFSKLFGNLVPKVGVGAAIGIDITGKPGAVFGLTLGYKF